MRYDLILINSPALTIKTIDHDLHYYHIYGNRSIIKFNSNVWFSSTTIEERENKEKVQKVVCKIILKKEYVNYKHAIEKLNLQSLSERRQILACRFSTKCVNSDKFNDLFPLNQNFNEQC